MPASFPMDEFRAFGLATREHFPATLSNEDMNDPLHRRTNFDCAWQAVRYRYRGAAEASDELRELLANPSALWLAAFGDVDFNYKLERCIYVFFLSAFSVFDSFAYCLYFLGHSLQPAAFPSVATPHQITQKRTAQSFKTTFPNEAITLALAGLAVDERFGQLDELRNILAHRLSGRRSIRASSTLEPDGTQTNWHEERWHIPGASESPTFDQEMLQRHLDNVAAMLRPLIATAWEFAEHSPKYDGAAELSIRPGR